MVFDQLPQYVSWSILLYLIYYSFRYWMQGQSYTKDIRCDGKTVLITGANTGIGKETAIILAKRGAKIIMACRNRNISEVARQEIIEKSGNENVHLMSLDLASFRSIRSFARELHQRESHLDILINNAGIMGAPKTMTKDGIESHMGVNYLGHFLLTLLLLDLLQNSTPSRIINVSSLGHAWIKFNKENWNSELSYNRFNAYLQSKLANVIFTVELAERIKNSGVTVNALHPGVVYTDISRNLDSFNFILKKWVCDIISKIFLKPTICGAQTTVYAALDFNLQTVSGKYLDNCWFAPMNEEASNEELRKWLWDKSEKITGVTLNNYQVTDHWTS